MFVFLLKDLQARSNLEVNRPGVAGALLSSELLEL